MGDEVKILLLEAEKSIFHSLEKLFSDIPGDKNYILAQDQGRDDPLKTILSETYDIFLVTENGAESDIASKALEKGCLTPFILITEDEKGDILPAYFEKNITDVLSLNTLSPTILERAITSALYHQKLKRDLRQEKQFSQKMIDDAPYLIIGVDQNGNISSINPATTLITGYELDDLKSKKWKSMLVDGGAQGDGSIEYDLSHNNFIHFEGRILCKSGEEKIIHWDILDRVFSPDKSEKTSFTLSGKDFTDTLKKEEKQKEKEKYQALGQLAGIVAHEINNLLQAILLSTELVKSSKVKDEIIDIGVEKIARNTKTASVITSDILTFARKDHRPLETLNFVKVFQENYESACEILPKTVKASLNITLENPDDIYCKIDSMGMKKLLSNLFLNAVHAMRDKGEVLVALRGAEKEDFIEYKNLDNTQSYLVLSVQDQGPEISKEVIKNIFDPSFATKEIGAAPALGLPIVNSVIQDWGGVVHVTSSEEEGTKFILFIPVLDQKVTVSSNR